MMLFCSPQLWEVVTCVAVAFPSLHTSMVILTSDLSHQHTSTDPMPTGCFFVFLHTSLYFSSFWRTNTVILMYRGSNHNAWCFCVQCYGIACALRPAYFYTKYLKRNGWQDDKTCTKLSYTWDLVKSYVQQRLLFVHVAALFFFGPGSRLLNLPVTLPVLNNPKLLDVDTWVWMEIFLQSRNGGSDWLLRVKMTALLKLTHDRV